MPPGRTQSQPSTSGSADRMEEIKTPDSLEESQGEDMGKVDRSDIQAPTGGRRCGVQMMGGGLGGDESQAGDESQGRLLTEGKGGAL